MGKKILLIAPPYHCGVVESAGRWDNLGFLYIAGELRKAGHEIITVVFPSLYCFSRRRWVVRRSHLVAVDAFLP